MKTAVAVLPLLLLCLGAGCKVGPDYRAPAPDVEEKFLTPEQTHPVLTAEPVPSGAWWRLLGDPELDRLIDESMQANRELRMAVARVREARARRGLALSGLFPTVDAAADYMRHRDSRNAAPFNALSVPGFPWEYNAYEAGFDAQWELDLFGGIRRGVEAADAHLSAAVEEHRGVLVSVAAEVARTYVELRGLQQETLVAEQNLAAQRETLALTRDLADKGLVTQLDVTRALAQVATTASQIPLLRRQTSMAIDRLALLTGTHPVLLAPRLAAPGPVPVPPEEVPVGLPAELLRRRPDIRRAERELAAATAAIGIAEAQLYPRLSLTGSFAFASSQTTDLFDWKSRTFGFGPMLGWSVLNFGRVRSEIRASTARQEQALAFYEHTVLAAEQEVHDAIAAFTTERERRTSLREAVAANSEAVVLSRQRYAQGLADFLEVLDAERRLYASQEALTQNERALTTALISLYKALGGGWEPPAGALGGPVPPQRAPTSHEVTP